MLLTILSFIFVLGIVVFFHELGHFLMAKAFGVRVHRFSLGFPPKMIGFTRGETEYCISWIPLGGYVKMDGDTPTDEKEGDNPRLDSGNLLSKAPWKRALVFVAGPLANYVTAIAIATGLFYFMGKAVVDQEKMIVGIVEENSPADTTGLKVGDIIKSINNQDVVSLSDLHKHVLPNPGNSMNIAWERNGLHKSALITPRLDTIKDENGEEVEVGLIGIVQQSDTVSVGFGEAVITANKATWNVTVMMVSFLKQWVTGEVSRKSVGGAHCDCKIFR